MAIHQRITHVGIHERAGALQLLSRKIRPVTQHGRHPLLVNLIAPAGPVEISERQAHQQIAEWRWIENTSVVETVKRFTSVAHTQLLGLGSQLIEGRGVLLVDGVLVGHQVGECAVGSRVR